MRRTLNYDSVIAQAWTQLTKGGLATRLQAYDELAHAREYGWVGWDSFERATQRRQRQMSIADRERLQIAEEDLIVELLAAGPTRAGSMVFEVVGGAIRRRLP